MDMRFNNILTPPHLKEGYKIMPPMDKDKYPEMPGLEGPFTLMSGKVVYYDPKEGAYYDKDTDMYMSYDEFQQHDNDYSNMKDERDEVKEVDEFKALDEGRKKNKNPMGPQGIAVGDRVEHEGDMYQVVAVDGDILTVDNLQNGNRTQFKMDDVTPLYGADAMTDQDEEDLTAMFKRLKKAGSGSLKHVATEGNSPRPKPRPKTIPRPKARPTINIGSNPETGSTRGINPRDNYSPEDLKRLLMQDDVAVRRDGKTLSKGEKAKLQRQGVLMKEGARGLDSIDWPEEEMMQTATDAIRYGYSKNDSFSHLYSMYGDDHGKWLRANEDMILDVFSQYMDESISEANESVEDIIKRAMKELKRIDPQVMFRTRDMMKAVATIKQGNIAGALQDLVNGVDGPENQIQDVFNDTHDTLQRLINPKTDKEVDDEYWADVDDMKARNRIGEGDGRKKGIHGKGHPMRKAQQAAIHANEGKMSDSIIDDSETMSKAEFTKKHGKEMADQYFESRKVSMNQVCEAVKQTDPTYAVAKYVRTTLDPSYKTWDQVHEQVEHILSCINEGNIVDANTVMQILSRTNLQEKADKGMMLKENIDSLRKIVRDKAYQTVKFSDGSMKVDLTTASMFLQVYEKQKPETQAKMDKMLGKKSGFLKLLDVMYSKMSQ